MVEAKRMLVRYAFRRHKPFFHVIRINSLRDAPASDDCDGAVMPPGGADADEPTTALDVTIQAQILQLTKYCKKRCRWALSLSLTIWAGGRDCRSGTGDVSGRGGGNGSVEQIFHAPQHPYTRALLAVFRNLVR